MTAPAFAAIETSMATAMLAAFANITLVNGSDVFDAVLDSGVEFVGEYGLTGDLRDRLTVLKSDAREFANGLVLHADPATYSVDELLAMTRSAWTLDRTGIR